ncbi:MAG TPA: ubiquitin-like protein Pup [Candidatus Eisenbacteria bacterium]|nr:ubiquitin-like protein Pup [Candidatus Eisenbacteria bacterium]
MGEQRRKTQPSAQSESASEVHDGHAMEKKGKKIGDELDALLDAIDDVLEENATEFVRDYVQHGGQ